MNVNVNTTVDVDIDGPVDRSNVPAIRDARSPRSDRPGEVNDNVHGGVQVQVQVKVNVG